MPSSNTLKTTISGNIVIGSAASPITIPVSTDLPPTTPGDLKFSYQLPTGTPPSAHISVSDLIGWASTALGSTITASDLPSSLTALSVAVDNITVDTTGKFDLGMLFGSDSGGTWDPSWTPITGFPVSLSNVLLQFDYGTQP
ncbi:hypothetical protein [Thalassospira alkalitolerans]|uniref:hypothetical protein n=1 Tax=Thalassospira alkalitolerans TaxID=1293890 RepID=UPI003AA95DFB|tara:strand:- start:258040 stop:258465 length:426 start_codon:yes stop_codon:yes gene_type:complete